MKLEDGKSYRRRDGKKVTIRERKFPFISTIEDHVYTKEGKYHSSEVESQFDLIEVWPEPTTFELTDGKYIGDLIQRFASKKTKVTIEVIE